MTFDTQERARLSRQLDRVRAIVAQGGWWTLLEIKRALDDGSLDTSISARLRQLANEEGWKKVKRIRTGNLWEYHMTPPAHAVEKKPAPQPQRAKQLELIAH